MSDPYVYLGQVVLKNKLNIHDNNDLAVAERVLTFTRIAELISKPKLATGSFDLLHMKNIHQYIFQDVYEWAGKPRTVQIEKGTAFCPAQHIEGFAGEIFQDLKRKNHLKGLDKDQFAESAAKLFGEINALHPFREGNGRTQRLFMYQLAKQAGWELDFQGVTQQQMIQASIDSFNGKYESMTAIFKDSLKEAVKENPWKKKLAAEKNNGKEK